jgi:hypothetical protein
MGGDLDSFVVFVRENYLNILFIVFFVFGLLILFHILGINLNAPKPDTHLIQQVTVETFAPSYENLDDLKMMPNESFCQTYLGNSAELEPACNQLTETNCANVSCCVFMKNGKGGKCVAGDSMGPTYKTDNDGKEIKMNGFHHLGKQY